MSDDAARATRNRPEWIWAGALLIVSAVLPFAARQLGGILLEWVWLVAMLAAAAAMVVFALGRDSVVARRPLGATALVVLGLFPICSWVWALATAYGQPGTNDPGAALVGISMQVVPLAAAIVAVVQIARAGVVPRRLRWVPLAALLLAVVPEVLIQVAAVTTPPERTQDLLPLMGLASLATFVAAVGLGVVAIVAGLQPRRVGASVQVYPPAGPQPGS